MKICSDCQFSKKEFVQVGPQQMAPVLVCLQEECRDPVEGGPIPCNVARQQPVFCGFAAKYFKAKEVEVSTKEEGSNLIQLK